MKCLNNSIGTATGQVLGKLDIAEKKIQESMDKKGNDF